jgi:hypothetical protein
MSRIQARGLGPALSRTSVVAPLIRDVAELEIEVIAEIRVQLGRALIGLGGLIVAAVAVQNIGQIL